MEEKEGLPVRAFASAAELEAWLDEHSATAPGLWVELAKKGSGRTSVSYAEAVEVGLCFGWIDSKAVSLDAQSYLQRFTPRGPRSGWSVTNRRLVERLTAEGRMRPAGVAAVEAAKAGGRWPEEPPEA